MNTRNTNSDVTTESISKAREGIRGYISKTPLLVSDEVSDLASRAQPYQCLLSERQNSRTKDAHDTVTKEGDEGSPRFRILFKCENTQRTGSFKVRGALNALKTLIDQHGHAHVQRKGVVTASSGNHAQGLALAAATFDVPATIVMPTTSDKGKVAGVMRTLSIADLTETGGSGSLGKIVLCGSRNEEKQAKLNQVASEEGSIIVPPYDHIDIITGQGTAACEISEQFSEMQHYLGADLVKAPDAIVAPLGGGGLLGGVASWFTGSTTKVFGAEPSFQGADDVRRGLQQGLRIDSVSSTTIADGLRTPVGKLNWEIVSDPTRVHGVFAVSEQEIKLAVKVIMDKAKLYVEPSAAVPLAVVLFNQDFRDMVAAKQGESPTPWDTVILLSGGNTTTDSMTQLLMST